MEDVIVAGAGVTGLAVALALARRGARVGVCDPAPLGDNASGVAAGMLAPAFEAALDPLSAGHFELLKTARDLWPGFAPVEIAREGAVFCAEAVVVEKVAAQLERAGAAFRPAAGELAGLFAASGLFTDEDWRLEPLDALEVLRAEAQAAGVAFAAEAVREAPPGTPLVLATGAAPGPAPELSVLTPIKGHVLRLSGGPAAGPVIRGEGIYIAPGARGAVVGATMEPGAADRAIDTAQARALLNTALVLAPLLEGLEATPQAAVRAGTPDGLPLVGWSERPGLLVAVGARRNGWLLAPLVAGVVAAYLAGEDPGPFAARLDARRFTKGDR